MLSSNSPTDSPMSVSKTSSPPSMSRPLAASFWFISASLSILTSRYILIESNYHYPSHLLLLSLFALLLVLGSHKFIASSNARESKPRWLSPYLEQEDLCAKRAVRSLPAALCLAISLPLTMQAILHWTNLSTLAMMPVFAHFCNAALTLAASRTSRLCEKGLYFVVLICCCAMCAVILYDEYRLTVENIVFAVLAMVSAGIASFLGQKNSAETTAFEYQDCDSRHIPTYRLTAIPLSIAMTLVWCVRKESTWAAAFHLLDLDPLLLGLNAASTVTAILLGGSFLVPLNVEEQSSLQQGRNAPWRAQIAASFALASLLGYASTYLTLRSYATILQTCAYLGALACLLTLPRSPRNGSKDMLQALCMGDDEDLLGLQPLNERTNSEDTMRGLPSESSSEADLARTPSGRSVVLSAPAVIAALVLWAGFLIQNFTPVSDPSVEGSQPYLDRSFLPSHEFDVVISMYEEPVESVTGIMEELFKIPEINASSPRLFLYTKNEALNASDIAWLTNATGAHNVVQLPNSGREGATYLDHILLNWDNLGRHTLFLQADVHNPREFFHRVRDYYAPNTGMLSLGFSGKYCDTDNCGDRWSWDEEPAILHELCRRVSGEACSKMLLSYKGQFIASAKRIRGVDHAIYQDLRTAMVDPGSWAHREPYLNGRTDSLNAPRFGYSLERFWSVLMQCSNEEIAWRCPTLLSGTRRGGSPMDCQCFDPADTLVPRI